MPSFAKKEYTVDGALGDAFAGDQVQNILQNMKNEARKRAADIIQREIPDYIAHLDGLIEAGKRDESSPLWRGHLKEGPYVKKNVQLVYQPSHGPEAERAHETPTIVIRGVDGLSVNESMNRLDEDSEVPGMRWQGRLVSNDVCDRLMDLLEEESEKAVTMGKELVHWVRLQIPQIEDGNTFGVEVQEEMIRQIEKVVQGALKAHSQPKSHYDDRMHLAQGWNKFPGLDDHAAAIASSDRFDYFLAVVAIKGLRDGMSELLSHLGKNWAKVHNPKNLDSTGGMY